MEHLNHNECLDLHIKYRNDVTVVNLLCRYEQALHDIEKLKRQLEEAGG